MLGDGHLGGPQRGVAPGRAAGPQRGGHRGEGVLGLEGQVVEVGSVRAAGWQLAGSLSQRSTDASALARSTATLAA